METTAQARSIHICERRINPIWVQQVLTHESVLDQNFWLTIAGNGLRHIMELPLMTVSKGCLTTWLIRLEPICCHDPANAHALSSGKLGGGPAQLVLARPQHAAAAGMHLMSTVRFLHKLGRL